MKIIPAFVICEDGAPPKLQVAEGAPALSNEITEMGLEVEQGGLILPEQSGPKSNQKNGHESADAEVGGKPTNGSFRDCMSAELARPEGSEPLTQAESRERFRDSVHECQMRKAEAEEPENVQV